MKYRISPSGWILFAVFGLVWLLPLYMQTGTWSRWAWEEFRVIVVGFLLAIALLENKEVKQ